GSNPDPDRRDRRKSHLTAPSFSGTGILGDRFVSPLDPVVDSCPKSNMIATEHTDAINSRILAISEDKIQGFVREPFREIATLSGVREDLVLERIRAMM